MGWNFPLWFELLVAPWAVVLHVIWSLFTFRWYELKWVAGWGVVASFILVGFQLAVLYVIVSKFVI
ncbi:hypothetical protein A616_16665 [Brevibacillus brevis X23]|nr:hypothetical protein A616_16665 [Brevibacillus brevis X23]